MTLSPEWSLRLLRKGVLLSESYQLFAGWDFGLAINDNLNRGIAGRQSTRSWDNEVLATIRRRVRHFGLMKSLIVLAQVGMPIGDWRHCLRLWVGATEEPFHTFAIGWLFEEHARGRLAIRSEDLLGVVNDTAGRRGGKAAPISDYSRVRAARDLLKTAGDLGMVEGTGPVKTFANISMSDDVLVYYVQLIADLEGDASKVLDSPLWRLAYMSPDDVHHSLLHLHQFRRLNYQVAGSLVQLAPPAGSALEFARQLA